MTTPTSKKPVSNYRKPVKREKATSTKGHYVTNEQLLPLIIRDKKAGRLSNELAKLLMLIAERYSLSPSFIRYSFRDELVAAAQVNLAANWHKFNEEVSQNPFSYYTTSCYHAFLPVLEAEKNQQNVRDALLVEAGANPSFNYQGGRSEISMSSDDSSFM